MRVLHVVGARPNFMKVAPIMREMARYPDEFEQLLVHTGQHYDDSMSKVFFEDLELSRPDVNLGVGSGSHAWQTAQVMLRFEPILLDHKPDWAIVVGDVNSTLACALVCSKLGVRVAHVEAGLRSFDRTMPEEINRLLTDQIADLLFTPSRDGNENLLSEGVAPKKIHFVGNVMIDTLTRLLPRVAERTTLTDLGLRPQGYVLVTLHRPLNVDDPTTLTEILTALVKISHELPVIFPVHPRTHQRITDLNPKLDTCNLRLVSPLGYLDFLALEKDAALVLTDSGGVQEETTYLGVPCLTARPNTERPVTITHGTNSLVQSERQALVKAAMTCLNWDNRRAMGDKRPELWDGQASGRIVRILRENADGIVV